MAIDDDLLNHMAFAMLGKIPPDASSLGIDMHTRTAIQNRKLELKAALAAAEARGFYLLPAPLPWGGI